MIEIGQVILCLNNEPLPPLLEMLMARRQRQLDATVSAMQSRYGAQALQRGTAITWQDTPPHIATGFAALDALTGCEGVLLGVLTLLSGRSTAGKLTLAYKLLAQAQVPQHTVALLDLTGSADPDYLQRCGVDLQRLVVVRPALDAQLLHLLLDLARSRQVRLLVVDGLSELTATRDLRRALPATLRRLPLLLRAAGCGVVLLDEPSPPWQRWLHAEGQGGMLTGYAARAQVLHSRWATAGRSATVEFVFNGSVRARETW